MKDTDVMAELRAALVGPARDWQERHRQGSFVTTPDQFVSAAIAALLPVVREIADQRAAEELEAAAANIRHTTTLGHIAERLERRAASLRGATDA